MRRASPGVAIAFVLWSTSVLAAPPASHWLLAQDFAESARDVRLGEKLRVEDVPLDPAAKGSRVPALGGFSAESGTLDLERIEVFGPGLVIVLHHGNRETRREAPDTAYFAGRIEGRAGSFAFLSIDRDGGTRGLISDAEGTWRIGSIGRTPHVEPIDPNQPFADSPAPWTCANEALPVLPARIAAQGNFARVAAAGTVYVANIALETDAEFYDMFGSTDDAVAYVGDLFAAISAIYQRDVGTLLRVSYLSLWPGTLNSDPWNASTTSSGLTEFETYWRNNRGSVPRSTAHFLSGKPTGGGIAYVGALCSTFYGFGFTGSLNGVFSTTSPSLYWDVLGVGHEIGHNFGSPHTHCFSPPVDQCYGGQAGCYTGPASVPSGGGSIMSYCHTRPGGYSNTNLWFGRTGFYGVQSERVPQTMRSLVESVSCLDEVDGAPAVSLTVTPGNIQPGGSATLSWTSTNADDCEFTSGLSGPTTPTGTLPVSPVSTTTYELECSGPDGTASDDATLTVGPAPTPSPTAVPTPSPLPTPTPVPTPTPSPSPVPMRVESSGACGSPPGCMTTLQSAIDLSENGYTIEVASGGYDEDIQVERPDLQPVILEPGWDESFTSRPNQTLTITSSGLTGETTIRSMTITAGTVMIR